MNTTLALMGMGSGEIILVFVVILVLFGAKKIPEFAKGLGQGIKEFKKASTDVSSEFHNALNQEPASPPLSRTPTPPTESVPSNPPSTVPKA